MNETSTARVTAVCLGLGGFAIGLIGGLASGAGADQILFRSIVSLFVCYFVGYVMGLVGGRVVDDAVRSCDLGDLAPTHGDSESSKANIPAHDQRVASPFAEAVP